MRLCRIVRRQVRRRDPAEIPPASREHLRGCPRCAADAESALLLRRGSELVATEPRPGFSGRLRARIVGEGIPANGSAWTESLALVARPALALAGAAVILALTAHAWIHFGGAQDDLIVLAGGDSEIVAILDGDVDDLLKGPGPADDPSGAEP